MKRALTVLVLLLVVVAGVVIVVGRGWLGSHEGPGEIRAPRRAAGTVEARVSGQRAAAAALGVGEPKQILFGDLHVHTTLSGDAFLISLPLAQGEGTHPPADACDFARICSELDFWSINDHAEGLTPQNWRETVESIRQCNAVAGDGAQPDTVAFLGWEWTQVGTTPKDHWGHKNVVLKGLADDEITARPIASGGRTRAALSGPNILVRTAFALRGGDERYHDFARFLTERAATVDCAEGVSSPELPTDCAETAETPGDLFRKLDEWDVPSIVIPHGTSWGMYTPPGSTWDKQLRAAQHDPDRQTLVELFSGHGNSEEVRDWRAVRFDDDGEPYCPEPLEDYEPSCWRAGEIIRGRCEAEGVAAEECDRRAAEARQNAAEAGVAAHITVPGESIDEWLDAGQCRDCFQPPMNHRPGGSVQYMLAIRNFDEPDGPERFRFGIMASSDNHFARPGTGYKEVERKGMTESRDIVPNPFTTQPPEEPEARSKPFDPLNTTLQGFQLVEIERQSSFFLTGGLIAAHSSGRGRDAIWDAMARKEVYATSGPRILLWFDLVNDDGSRLPMGSSVRTTDTPRFEVRAVGSFEQKPGCPDSAVTALGPERLESVCKGECYHPSDTRRRITRIEIVRIRPQVSPDESVAGLVEDPWRVVECTGDPEGCRVEFEDSEFAELGRDVVYYARAIEEPSLAINAGNLRCERDADGRCIGVDRCGKAESRGDDCLAETEERAWSSPVFVDWAGAGR